MITDVAATPDYAVASNILIGNFKILPQKTTVTKAITGKGKVTVKWKKLSPNPGITKWEVRYKLKTAKTWGKAKTVAAPKTSYTIKGLKKNKQYDVQVRSYKTVGGIKYYSDWSTKKTSGKVK